MDGGLQNHEWCSSNRGCAILVGLQNATLSLNRLTHKLCAHTFDSDTVSNDWYSISIERPQMRAMIGMREFANVKRDWKYISFRFCNIFFSELAIYFAQNWQYILSRFGNIFHWDLLRMHIFNHQSAWLKPSDWMSHCEYTAHFPPSEVWWMQAISYKLTSLGSWPARENSF